jgi:hypothetical protein
MEKKKAHLRPKQRQTCGLRLLLLLLLVVVVVGDGVHNLCVTVSRIYRKKEKTSLSFGPSSYALRHVHGLGFLGGNSKVIIVKT